MTDYQPAQAAAVLHEVRLRRTQVAPLAAAIAPRTEAEGAAVQHALAQRTGAAPPAGFKIGATARRMQEYLGLSGPAAGFMAVGNLHRSGATVRFADFCGPVSNASWRCASPATCRPGPARRSRPPLRSAT